MSDYDAAFQSASSAVIGASKPGDDYDAIMVNITPKAVDRPQVAQEVGKSINANLTSIPRQLGLTARYAIEGPAQAAQIFTEPLAGFLRLGGIKTKPLGEVATAAANWMGLPSPEGANERVIGDATRLVAGAGVLRAAAGAGSVLPGILGKVFTGLAAAPAQQLSSAAGAGLAGGASREAGGDSLLQTGASLLGGVAGGAVPGVASSAYNAVKSLATRATPAQLDQQISLVLQRANVDYSQLPQAVKNSLRSDMATALQAGKEIDPAAVARLADFKMTNTTPTRGMVSQNPVQITREMNLAKIAANSADDGLHGLPLLQNQNNQTLIRNLNESGASRGDPFHAGSNAISAIAARDAEQAAHVTGLYSAARDMPGGNIPLNRAPIINGIYDALARENKMAFLPENVSAMLNTISKGSMRVNGQDFNVPFDAKTLDNLMTTIATAQRGTQDGNVKAALAIARRAIDSVPVSPIKAPAVGNPLVTESGAAYLRNADAEAPAFMSALNDARAAARSRFGWQESARPIEAALGGAQPDNFVKRFVIDGTLEDARALAQNAPSAGVKEAIVAHLKDKALNSASDEIGKFSQSAYNKALSRIGDRKLSLFFSPEEISYLKANGRVASYMQVQPVGSAVNNSNSGALMIGKVYDAIKGGLGMVPGAGPVTAGLLDLTLGNPTKNAAQWIAQRNAQNYVPGLLTPEATKPSMAKNLLLPGIAMGGLLAAP